MGNFVVWLALLGATPRPDPPPPVTLTAKEQVQIDKGKIVVRYDDSSATGGGATGITDIDATVDVVWTALFDFKARVREIGALKEVTAYQGPGDVNARWQLSILGTSIGFHIAYDTYPEKGWCSYAMDESQQNDLLSVEGAYQVYPQGSGSRLVYQSKSDSGRKVPDWIKKWLASDSLKEQIGGVKKRAEAANF